MKESQSAIEIRDLTRRYGKLEAVHGVSLTVRAGCCYGFFGRNGAGKTTTIRMITGIFLPDSGTIQWTDPQHANQPQRFYRAFAP